MRSIQAARGLRGLDLILAHRLKSCKASQHFWGKLLCVILPSTEVLYAPDLAILSLTQSTALAVQEGLANDAGARITPRPPRLLCRRDGPALRGGPHRASARAHHWQGVFFEAPTAFCRGVYAG